MPGYRVRTLSSYLGLLSNLLGIHIQIISRRSFWVDVRIHIRKNGLLHVLICN